MMDSTDVMSCTEDSTFSHTSSPLLDNDGPSDCGEVITNHPSNSPSRASPLSTCTRDLTEQSQRREDTSFTVQHDTSLPIDTEDEENDGSRTNQNNETKDWGSMEAVSMPCALTDTGHEEKRDTSSAASTGTEDYLCGTLTSVCINKICTLCDDPSIVAVAYCSECDDSLCSACVHRHSKMSLAAHHDVQLFECQQFNDNNSASHRLSIHNSIMAVVDPCPKHPGERLRFFCNTCQTPVCRDCILTIHKQHDIQDIADVTFNARKELVDMLAELEKKKGLLKMYHSQFEDYKVQLEQTAERVGNMIRSYHDEVKAAIDASYQKLIGDLEECKKTELDRIQNQGLVIQNNIEDVTRLVHQQSLNMDSSIHILNRHEMVSQALKTLSENIQQINLVQGNFFISKNPRLITIPENVLGQITFTAHTLPWSDPQPYMPARIVIREVALHREVAFNISEPNSSKSTVQSVAETPNGTVWVATPLSLLKVTSQAVKRETINITDSITGIAAGPGEKLLVSLGQGSAIKVYDTNGAWTPFISLLKGNLVVASRLEHNRLQVHVAVTPQAGPTRIVSYSTEGRVCQQLKLQAHPEDRTPSSSLTRLKPSCLAVGWGGRLYLGDTGGRRVLVVDREGGVIGQYLGPGGHGGCHPSGVCVVAPGQVAVADSERCTVELVSAEGKLLAPLVSRDQLQPDSGVPTCLTVDSKHRLWIGTSKGHVYAFSFLRTCPTSSSCSY